MSFKIVETREFLVPITYTKKPGGCLGKKSPCFQVKWELRPLWVLKINTNDPDYIYESRVVSVSYTHLTLPTN